MLGFRDHTEQEAGLCMVLGEPSSNWCSFLCWCWCRSREHRDTQCYVINLITEEAGVRSQINRVSGHQVKKLKSNWHMISKVILIDRIEVKIYVVNYWFFSCSVVISNLNWTSTRVDLQSSQIRVTTIESQSQCVTWRPKDHNWCLIDCEPTTVLEPWSSM